jgi:hypothetical protein
MSLPSKPQQIAAVSKLLDSDFTEGKSLTEVAKAIVDGYHEALIKDLKKPATPLRQGMLFKMPTDNKARRVAWMGEGRVWIVGETDSYGWLGSESNPTWQQCEEFHPKAFVVIDGKRKLLEMSDEQIEEAWSNPEWIVGDVASQRQRQHIFEVIATGPQCVLMRDSKTGVLNADSTSNLAKHYQRERQVGKVVW